MTQDWEDDLGLPRFVLLLRLASGPVSRGFRHCDVAPETAAIEEEDELQAPEQIEKYRVILQCHACEQYFWAWEGAEATDGDC